MSEYFRGGKIKRLQRGFNFDVAVVMFIEDGYFYAVAPAMDIVGAGKNEAEARASFAIVMDEFIKYTCNKRTFLEVLTGLGWDVPDNYAKKFKAKWPELEELKTKQEWALIWNMNPHFESYNVKLPF